jgi:hypothetical protein
MAKKKKEKKEAEKPVPKEKKEALIDLVESAPLPLFVIIMDLSRVGLDKELEEQVELRSKGLKIPKTITKTEFNQIIGVR